jgi:hypothetical protein
MYGQIGHATSNTFASPDLEFLLPYAYDSSPCSSERLVEDRILPPRHHTEPRYKTHARGANFPGDFSFKFSPSLTVFNVRHNQHIPTRVIFTVVSHFHIGIVRRFYVLFTTLTLFYLRDRKGNSLSVTCGKPKNWLVAALSEIVKAQTKTRVSLRSHTM